MRRGVVQRVVCYWICGCALALLIAVIAYAFGGTPFALRRFAPSIARGISPGFPDGSMWEWQEERSTFSVAVTSWVRSDDELKAYQLGALPGFEVVERPRWWCYGMERLMPPAERLVRDHDVPFVVDRAFGWPIVSLSKRSPGPELLREMAEGRRADDGELLGVGSEGLPRAQIGLNCGTCLSSWGWNDGVWPSRVLWPGVILGGAFWGALLAVPELMVRARRAVSGKQQETASKPNEIGRKSGGVLGIGKQAAAALAIGVAMSMGVALLASALEEAWPFRMDWSGRFTFGESELKANGRAWRWTVMGSLARTTVNSEIEDESRKLKWKDMSYEEGLASQGSAPSWSIPAEQPMPPVIRGEFDEMMPSVTDDAFGFPWRCLARRLECYDIRFNKGMRGTPPVTAGMGRVSGMPLLVSGIRIEIPVLGGVVNSGWWPTRVLWAGLLANSLLIATLWMLVLWTWRRLTWLKEEWRRRRGLCVECCYRLDGIAIGANCPECGHERMGTRGEATSNPV